MEVIEIQDAAGRLEDLIAAAVDGKPFVIAEAGKPLVKVSAVHASDTSQGSRLLRPRPPGHGSLNEGVMG